MHKFANAINRAASTWPAWLVALSLLSFMGGVIALGAIGCNLLL